MKKTRPGMVGRVYPTNNFGDVRIIDYTSPTNVVVEFLATGFVVQTSAPNVRKGQVRDKTVPSVVGVGFLGSGPYRSKHNGELTKVYVTWSDMLSRCYNPKRLAKDPTYLGCTVDKEWHNFQNFGKWFDANYIEGYELDKDIKVKGNRVYGPSTCSYVTPQENTEEACAKHYKFINPKGEPVDIYNMRKFCRGMGLTPSLMHKVASGERVHHRGWRKRLVENLA